MQAPWWMNDAERQAFDKIERIRRLLIVVLWILALTFTFWAVHRADNISRHQHEENQRGTTTSQVRSY